MFSVHAHLGGDLGTQSPVFQCPHCLELPPYPSSKRHSWFQNHVLNNFSVLDTVLGIRDTQMSMTFSQGRQKIMERKRHIKLNKTKQTAIKCCTFLPHHSKSPILSSVILILNLWGNHKIHLRILYKLWTLSLGGKNHKQYICMYINISLNLGEFRDPLKPK